MRAGGFPVVTLKIRGMEHAIQTAFTEHVLSLDKDVQAAVASAVSNFDFRKEASAAADRYLREATQNACKSAVNQVFFGKRDAIQNAIVRALFDVDDEGVPVRLKGA